MPPKKQNKPSKTPRRRRAAQQNPVGRQRAASASQNILQVRSNRGQLAAQKWFHCVLSNPSMVGGAGVRYPDGFPQNTIAMELRSTYTLLPTTGSVRFRLLPTPYGGLCMTTGTLSSAVNGYGSDTAAPSGFGVTQSTTAVGCIAMPQSPVDPLNGIGASSGSNFTMFRPVALVASVNYTGSSMLDNGSVTIRRVPSPYLNGETNAVTYSTTFTDSIPCVDVASTGVDSLSPDSFVGQAKKNYTSRAGLGQYDFARTSGAIAFRDNGTAALSSAQIMYSNLASAGSYNLSFSPAPDASSIEYRYSGLDASASITVDLRYCVEYTISPNDPLAPFSGFSEPGDPSLLAQMKMFLRDLPVATIANGLAAALPKTLLGKAAGVVAGMMH
jgi:hypothetical protein